MTPCALSELGSKQNKIITIKNMFLKLPEHFPALSLWEQKMITQEKIFEREGVLDVVQHIILAEPQAGVYLVGGSVRDILIGRQSKDYDFVVTGVDQERLIEILGERGNTGQTGSSFGVIKNNPEYQYLQAIGEQGLAEPFDFALPRNDHESGSGGHHDTIVTVDKNIPIAEDLLRRDLTINSLAWDIVNKCFVYPKGKEEICKKDLEEKIIRTVDSPEKSFGGDWLRMLRAIRFSCQLEGFALSPDTMETIQNLSAHINDVYEQDIYSEIFDQTTGEKIKKIIHKKGDYKIARERVAEELLKSFYSNPLKALDLYEKSGFLKHLLPQVDGLKGVEQSSDMHSEGDVYIHTRLALEKLNDEKFKFYAQIIDELFPDIEPVGVDKLKEKLELICSVLFHDLGKPATKATKEEEPEKITFYGHDKKSAELSAEICQKLRLETPIKYKIDPCNVKENVGGHMFFFLNIDEVKDETIYKKFFATNNRSLVRNQFKLAVADILASIPEQTQEPDFSNFEKLIERIKIIKEKMLTEGDQEKITLLLDGQEIMELLDIKKGGKIIGQLKYDLLAAQIGGQIKDKNQAIEFIKKRYSQIKE